MIKLCWWRHGQKLWLHSLYFEKPLRSRVANFANIIEITTIFIKTTLKDSKKVKRIRIYVLRCNLYLCSWYNKSYWFTVKNCWCQHNSKVVSRELYVFCHSRNFINVEYLWQILGRVPFRLLLIHESVIDGSYRSINFMIIYLKFIDLVIVYGAEVLRVIVFFAKIYFQVINWDKSSGKNLSVLWKYIATWLSFVSDLLVKIVMYRANHDLVAHYSAFIYLLYLINWWIKQNFNK